jgi:hypothetical protein
MVARFRGSGLPVSRTSGEADLRRLSSRPAPPLRREAIMISSATGDRQVSLRISASPDPSTEKDQKLLSGRGLAAVTLARVLARRGAHL